MLLKQSIEHVSIIYTSNPLNQCLCYVVGFFMEVLMIS